MLVQLLQRSGAEFRTFERPVVQVAEGHTNPVEPEAASRLRRGKAESAGAIKCAFLEFRARLNPRDGLQPSSSRSRP